MLRATGAHSSVCNNVAHDTLEEKITVFRRRLSHRPYSACGKCSLFMATVLSDSSFKQGPPAFRYSHASRSTLSSHIKSPLLRRTVAYFDDALLCSGLPEPEDELEASKQSTEL